MPESSDRADLPATIKLHASWSLEIGRLRFAVMRTREVERSFSAVASKRSLWPFASGAITGVGAVALLVGGATAAPRDVVQTRYIVSVPVPNPVEHRVARPALRKATVGRATPPAIAPSSGERFDAADETYVNRGMATGAFQEWDDDLGQHRFLTAGPARFEGGRYCRNMALLVRLAEGGSRVRSATRCTTEPVSEAPAQPDTEAPDVFDGADADVNPRPLTPR